MSENNVKKPDEKKTAAPEKPREAPPAPSASPGNTQPKPAPKPAARKPKPKPDPRSKLYKPEGRPFVISSSPHFSSVASVPKIMWMVVAALIPATLLSVYYFHFLALRMILACIAGAVATELIINRIKGEGFTIKDGSVVITGLLLALTLPPSLPVSSGILGSVFAIAVGKQIFGGLGYNIFNPALLGRAFLQASFPVAMTTWTWPKTGQYSARIADGLSAATPLGMFKFDFENFAPVGREIYTNLFTGNVGGCIGETSVIAILIGGIFLLVKRYADWRIPVSYLGTVFIFGGIFWLVKPSVFPNPFFQLFSGGLMLGAFFMATDMVTSPITPKGSWVFGIGAGIILVIIRLFGGLPEGVMYSILLMNAATPLINRYTRPKFFGEISA